MASWQLYVALAVIFYTLNTLLNKVTARDRPGEFASLALQLVASFLLLPTVEGLPSGSWVWGWTLLASFLYGVSSLLVFDAYSIGDVSIIAPLFNFQPVVLLFLAVFFLGESFGMQKLLGVLLVALGASHLKKSHDIVSSLKALFEEKSAALTLAATALFAGARTIDKMVLPFFDTTTYAFVQWFLPGCVVATYVLGRHEAKDFFRFFRRRFIVVLVNGITGVLGNVSLLLAIRQAEVSVVVPLANLSTFFAVLLSHKLLGEKMNGRPIAAAVMVAGAILVLTVP